MNSVNPENPAEESTGNTSEPEIDSSFLSLHARYGSEVVSVIGPDNTLLYESDSVEEMLGYRHTDEALAEDNRLGQVHPEDSESVARAMEACFATPGEHPPVEYRMRDAEGNWRWLESLGVNLLSAPEVGGVVVSTRDITDRKRAEEALKESEKRFRQLFEQSVDTVLVHDEDGNVVDANQQAVRSLGYSRDELLRLKVSDYEMRLLSEEERAERERSGGTLWQRVLANEPGGVIETSIGEHRRNDGTTFPVEVLVGGVDYGGRRMILSSIRDITERKLASEAVAESEERFRIAFEEAPVGVALVGMSGHLLRVNHALSGMLGYTKEELLSMTSYGVTHPDDRAPSQEWMKGQERSDTLGQTIELRYVRKDGSVLWALVSASLVRDFRGEPGHWVCHYQDITGRKALEERLHHQALHDPLTGLPGRALLTERVHRTLELSRRRKESVAVLFVDVDNLKIINDSLGHKAGDRLLRVVGERLHECVREGDTVARFGGDEFVVLLDRPGDEEDALLVVRRILKRLEEPLLANGYEVPLTVSVGIAFSASPGLGSSGEISPGKTDAKNNAETDVESAESAEDLIRHADTAMYQAKAAGGGDYAIFRQEMDRDNFERLELSSDLHRAIERGELKTYYQHKVDLSTGGVAGWEALLRWEHPERGLIPPETFIPRAEETGLIVPIGKWVLEEACKQARVWRKRFPKEPGQFMSVNLSAKQFADPDLEEEIARILERTGLPARALDLEITERVLLEDELFDFARIRALKDSGLSFSLDDFGTGYSSLLSLKQLPADFIKIDRSFVERVPGSVEDEAFVTAIVGLARALGIKVVAEGIETESQWRRLRELGCEYGQGYHFSPPLPSEEALRSMELLEDHAGA